MKTIAIVQARQNSKRFPNKVLKKLNSQTIIDILNDKLKKSKKINDIVFAIPLKSSEKKLKNYLISKQIDFYEGSEKTV